MPKMDAPSLLNAIAADGETGETLVRAQLDFVVKWLVFALCSRETTVGLQSVLELTKELFSYLCGRKYEISDPVALELVPYIFEEASNGKG